MALFSGIVFIGLVRRPKRAPASPYRFLRIAMSLLGRLSTRRRCGIVGLGQLAAEKPYSLGQRQNFLFSQGIDLLMQ